MGVVGRTASRAILPVTAALTAVEAVKIIKDQDLTKEEKIDEGAGLAGGTAGAAAGVASGALVGAVAGPVGALLGGLIGGGLGFFGGDFLGRKTAGLFNKPPEEVEADGDNQIVTRKIEAVVGDDIPDTVPPRPKTKRRARANKGIPEAQAEWDAKYGLSYDEDGNKLSMERQNINVRTREIDNVTASDNVPITLAQRNRQMQDSALTTETGNQTQTGNTAVINAPTSVTTNKSNTAIVVPTVRNNEMALQNSQSISKGGF